MDVDVDVRPPSQRPRTVWVVALGMAVAGMLAAGCSAVSVSAGPPPPTTVTSSNLAGARFCEVSITYKVAPSYLTNIYSTYPLNACPGNEWRAVSTATIASLDGGVAVRLSGPRYWLADAMSRYLVGEDAVTTTKMGKITMHQVATARTASPERSPFVPESEVRQATLTFRSGQQVYELTDPTGRRWVMESWSRGIDPSLQHRDLVTLGGKLTLPRGWSYATRRLNQALVIATTTRSARVVQDNLEDSYSLESTSHG